ncbi:electron transport complex subunit RsxB [Catenovulum sp. SM1970]|uniref:electron transport complex subunit RsxB n=1 Tax=Marinifaba aquimaris TaxID=2741323 RepID=UPI001571CD1C|nr:electron transport complex subunit RsxB [Marinifaba aquimaris]NTS78452.1 electron transport complex subunit RsxB [Marinifaba aquimaris]
MTLISALIVLGVLALIFGSILGYAAIKYKVDADPLVDQIDEILPQTQCGQCGYPGCKPYAQAIADGDDINKCPPGGDNTIHKIADLTGREYTPLAGTESDDVAEEVKKVAYIREDECIGCTKCIQACPVDAIVGASKAMHTVITDECTGCDLCVDPCPVDCIDMLPLAQTTQSWKWQLDAIPVKQVH